MPDEKTMDLVFDPTKGLTITVLPGSTFSGPNPRVRVRVLGKSDYEHQGGPGSHDGGGTGGGGTGGGGTGGGGTGDGGTGGGG